MPVHTPSKIQPAGASRIILAAAVVLIACGFIGCVSGPDNENLPARDKRLFGDKPAVGSRISFGIETPSPNPHPPGRRVRLKTARTWMYQIQDLNRSEALETLAATDYPLLVIEPGHNLKEDPYDTPTVVRALHRTPSGDERLLLAYIDIGQAEDYRDYWGPDWQAPAAGQRGRPDFIVTADPDGWSGNYPVAYWRPEWKNTWIGPGGIVPILARFGFDGIYLDWVEAYDDEYVRAAAREEGVSPEDEMIRFIEELGRAGGRTASDFLVVVQNAPYLIDHAPGRYAKAIDGLAVEDTWFHGLGDADWHSAGAGDLPNRSRDEWSTPARLKQYRLYQDYGLPVFSVDYCVSPENAARVYREARAAGLSPLVTRVPLSRLTETPPEDFP